MYPLQTLAACAAFLSFVVSGHVQLFYPEWRGNSFEDPFSQLIQPCAGIYDNKTTPRTPWPLTGGSLNFALRDDAALIWINLGLGVNTTNFNYTLVGPLNETGAGNLCFPTVTLPEGLPISDGSPATIQVATVGPDGEGLYNCADIVFQKNATLLSNNDCKNSSTTVHLLQNADSSSTQAAPSATPTTKKSRGFALSSPSWAAVLFLAALQVMI